MAFDDEVLADIDSMYSNEDVDSIERNTMGVGDNFFSSASSAFRDDNIFIKAGQSAVYNYQDHYELDEDVSQESITERLDNSLVGEKYKSTILERAKNSRHLDKLVAQAEEWTGQDSFKDKNAVLGGLGWHLLSGATEVLPLVASAPFAVGGMAAMTASAGRRFIGGAIYESVLEVGKHNLGTKDREMIESMVAVASAGTFNAILGKPAGASLKMMEDSAKKSISETANMPLKDVEKMVKLHNEGKTKEAEAMLDAVVPKDVNKQSLWDSMSDMNKNKNMLNSTYQALRVDMQHLVSESPSSSFKGFGDNFFFDPTLKNIDAQKNYLGNQAVEIDKELQSTFQQGYAELVGKYSGDLVFMAAMKGNKREEMFDIIGEIGHIKQFGMNGVSAGNKNQAIDYGINKLVEKGLDEKQAKEIATSMVDLSDKYWAGTHDILAGSNKSFGEGQIPKDANYRPIQYKHNAVNNITTKGTATNEQINNWWFNAWLRNLDPEIHKDLTGNIEKMNEARDQMANWVKGRFNPQNESVTLELAGRDYEKDALAALEAIAQGKSISNAAMDKTASSLMRRSMNIDTSYEANGLRYFDFIETNEEIMAIKYSRELSGRTALSNYKHKTKIDGKETEILLDNDANILQFKSDITDELNQAVREGKMTYDKSLNELARLDHIIKNLTGKPTADNPFSQSHKIVDILKNFTNAKLLGQVAFSQPAEIVTSVGYFGAKNMWETIPQAKKILKLLSSGKVTDDEAQEIFDNMGYGLELLQGVSPQRYTDEFSPSMSSDNVIDKIHKMSEQYADATYLVSGMKQITTMLQVSSMMSLQKEFIKFGTDSVVTPLMKRIQKDMKLSDEMRDRMASQFNRYTDIIHGDGTVSVGLKETERKITGNVKWINKLEDAYGQKPAGLSETKGAISDIMKKALRDNPEFNKVLQDAERKLGKITDINKVLKDIDSTITEMADIFPVSTVRPKELVDAGGKWIEGAKEVQIDLVDFKDLLEKTIKEGKVDGYEKTIKKIQSMIAHEFIHAGTVKPYDTIPEFKTALDSLFKTVEGKNLVDSKGNKLYGATEPKEMVAEALTNKTFMNKLNDIQVPDDYMKLSKDLGKKHKSKIDNVSSKLTDLMVDDKVNDGSVLSELIKTLRTMDATKEYVVRENGYVKGSTVKRVNYDSWDDKEAADLTKQMFRILVDSNVQLGHLQDSVGVAGLGQNLLTNSVFGKLFLSLKTYMIQAYTKQLGRTVNTMDMNKAMTLTSQMFFLTLAAAVQESINYAGTDKFDDKMKLGHLLEKAVSRLSISSYVPAIADTALYATTGNTISGSRYHKATDIGTHLFAPATVIDDLFSVTKAPYNILSGNPEKAGKSILNVLPNWLGVQTAKNIAREELSK